MPVDSMHNSRALQLRPLKGTQKLILLITPVFYLLCHCIYVRNVT